jgi:hypothetical protein
MENNAAKTQMNMRVKLFVIGFLLCIALGGAVYSGIQAVQAFQHFQQHHQQLLSGDVSTISPWMTIPYISRVYHVPESYLDEQLHITDPRVQRHESLLLIAQHYNRPVEGIIHEVQNAILTYRKQHPTPTPTPTATSHTGQAPPAKKHSPSRKEPG